MIKFYVGANCVRPPELWLNHKFDICFWYGKNIGCLYKILVKQTGEHSSPLQKQSSNLCFKHDDNLQKFIMQYVFYGLLLK